MTAPLPDRIARAQAMHHRDVIEMRGRVAVYGCPVCAREWPCPTWTVLQGDE